VVDGGAHVNDENVVIGSLLLLEDYRKPSSEYGSRTSATSEYENQVTLLSIASHLCYAEGENEESLNRFNERHRIEGVRVHSARRIRTLYWIRTELDFPDPSIPGSPYALTTVGYPLTIVAI
jgi:hypothetical protein